MATPASMLPSHSLVDRIYNEAVEAATNQIKAKQSAASRKEDTRQKQSSPLDEARQKLSTAKQRNDDLVRLGEMIEQIGHFGFEKAAMEASDGDTSVQSVEGDNSNTDARIVAMHAVRSETGSGGGTQPDQLILSRGGSNPDNLSDKANPSATAVGNSDGSGPMPTGMLGDGATNLSSAPENISIPELKMSSTKLSSVFQKISGGKFPADPVAAGRKARSLGIRGPEDALALFKRSAAVRGLTLREFVAGAEFDSFERSKLLRKVASAQPRYKGSEAALDVDVAKAKDTIESVVKATGTLPTSEEVSRAANVDPMASNVALYEVGEFIAAVGGGVGATAAPPMDPGVPVPAMAGAVPGGAPVPPPGMPAGMGAMMPPPPAPVASPMAPPPMDPSMMGGAPPAGGGAPPPPAAGNGGPGMVATASAHSEKKDDEDDDDDEKNDEKDEKDDGEKKGEMPAFLQEEKTSEQRLRSLQSILSRWSKNSADSDVVTDREESTAGSGISDTTDLTTDPKGGAPAGGVTSFTMSPTQRAQVDSVLASNTSVTSTNQADTQAWAEERTQNYVNTPVDGPSKKDQVEVGGEQPKGTQEGDLGLSAHFEGKTSSNVDVFRRTEELVGLELSKLLATKTSSVRMADGRGTSEIHTTGGGGGQSDTADPKLRKAMKYVESQVQVNSRVPAVEDVMEECNVDISTAKTAIARAVANP